MDAYVYVKQQKCTQDGQAVFFNVCKKLLGPNHVARQAAEAGKLHNSQHDEKKGWDWDKYVALHKEQHMIMESLADHGYSGINEGIEVCHFLQLIRNTELKAAINVVWAQSEKYGKEFVTIVSYLGQMVIKKGYNMQSVNVS